MGNQVTVVTQVKGMLNNEGVKRRFNEILGNKANQFTASIVNAVSTNNQLQKCDANSIMSAAFVAASFDLPIDSNLGFSAIVPYKDKAQFQMMYKGFIQLAIRSGQYKSMNYAEVYEDELKTYNPITKEVEFVTEYRADSQRQKGETSKVVGYYAWLELLNGFKQGLYMTMDEVKNHASTYSASYKRDIQKGWKSSKWSTDFDAMAKKTVIKLLLSKWGVLSIDMQKAIELDQQVFNKDGDGSYADNPENAEKEIVDPFAEVVSEQ